MKVLILAALLPLPAMAQDRAAMCATVLDQLAAIDAAAADVSDQAFYISDQAHAFAGAIGGDVGNQIARRADHDRATLESRADAATDAANEARAALMAYCAP